MRASAILVALAGLQGALAARNVAPYRAQNCNDSACDPCKNLQKHQCLKNNDCQYDIDHDRMFDHGNTGPGTGCSSRPARERVSKEESDASKGTIRHRLAAMPCGDFYTAKDCRIGRLAHGGNECWWHPCGDDTVDYGFCGEAKPTKSCCSVVYGGARTKANTNCNANCDVCIIGPMAHEGRGAVVVQYTGRSYERDSGDEYSEIHKLHHTEAPFLEIGDWGIVGDDSDDWEVATVLCKQMGYNNKGLAMDNWYYDNSDWPELDDEFYELDTSYNGVDYGRFPLVFEGFGFQPRPAGGDDDYSPWEYHGMGEVGCTGDETNIWDCVWESNNCGPDEVLGIDCKPTLDGHACSGPSGPNGENNPDCDDIGL